MFVIVLQEQEFPSLFVLLFHFISKFLFNLCFFQKLCVILPDQDNDEEEKDQEKTKETVPVHDVGYVITFQSYDFQLVQFYVWCGKSIKWKPDFNLKSAIFSYLR